VGAARQVAAGEHQHRHNNLLFLSTTSHSYAIDIGSHQQVWSYPAGGTLALSSQGLFIAQQSGRLAAIKVQ